MTWLQNTADGRRVAFDRLGGFQCALCVVVHSATKSYEWQALDAKSETLGGPKKGLGGHPKD